MLISCFLSSLIVINKALFPPLLCLDNIEESLQPCLAYFVNAVVIEKVWLHGLELFSL